MGSKVNVTSGRRSTILGSRGCILYSGIKPRNRQKYERKVKEKCEIPDRNNLKIKNFLRDTKLIKISKTDTIRNPNLTTRNQIHTQM